MKFELRTQPLLPKAAYYRRVARYAGFAFTLLLGSLGLGVVGYRYAGGLEWLDALVNASMLLGGMGPVNPLTTTAGKLFASFYALFAGMIFLIAAGIFLSPIFHRFLHKFHLEVGEDTQE